MATKYKRSSTKRKSAVNRAAAEAKRFTAAGKASHSSAKSKGTRLGRRTTLRVPDALEAEISRTAAEHGITENEALIHLAQLGAISAERRRDVRRVIEARRSAVSGSPARARPAPLPSPAEVREAILVDRD